MQSDDVSIKGIGTFLAILAVTLVIIYLAITAFWRGLEKRAQQTDERLLARETSAHADTFRPYFPAPREQPAPQVDLQSWRAQEQTELATYGWVDKQAGIVRIPIDRAIELLTPSTKGTP